MPGWPSSLAAWRATRRPRRLARAALPFGVLYFAAMVVRYVVRMARHPEARRLGGS